MAKKKTKSSKSSASARKTKTVVRRISAVKKAASKKTSSGKSGVKKGKAAATKPRKSSGKTGDPNSVDGILKKFFQEKSSLDVHLSSLEKKIADLEKKTKLYQEQLVTLGQDKETTLESIAQIDTRRDLEVSQLLSKLGVKLTEIAQPAATTTGVIAGKPTEELENGQHQNNSEDRFSVGSEDE